MCYGSLSPLVDEVLSTRLVFLRAGPAGDLDCRNMMTSYGERAGMSRRVPSPGLQTGWAGTSFLLCSRMKHSPPGSWLRHDSDFISTKLPVKQIIVTFALSSPVDPQRLCWCRQGVPVGSWEMPATLNIQVGILWDSGAGGINSHTKTPQEANTLTLHLFHIKNLYKSVMLKIFPSFPLSLTLFGKRHMELIMNKGRLF